MRSTLKEKNCMEANFSFKSVEWITIGEAKKLYSFSLTNLENQQNYCPCMPGSFISENTVVGIH